MLVGAGFVDRVEVLAEEVLDEGDHETVFVGWFVADVECRHCAQPGPEGGFNAAVSCEQNPLSVRVAVDGDGG